MVNASDQSCGAQDFKKAARAIADADAIVVAAGAGLGVDSGLPDFRGDQGFWRAYPPLKELGISFVDMANPRWFDQDPRLAWGFYGHRMHLYRDTVPHRGFELLSKWVDEAPMGGFVFTSNVDGQFQRAGFDDEFVLECHGSIHHLQCATPCRGVIWSGEAVHVAVDPGFVARGELPTCPSCGGIARPNVLMFGDGQWSDERTARQESHLETWFTQSARFCVVELGAGKSVPTVRRFSESILRSGGSLVRINPRDSDGPPGTISLAAGALAGLEGIERAMGVHP